MKKLIIILLLLCPFAAASEYTDYISDMYSKEYNKHVKIVSKDEHIEK